MADLLFRTDADLLLDYARRRGADAFGELVRRYGRLVHGVGLRITRNADDAADVAQECFLALAAQAGQIAAPLPAWLHQLARGKAIDALRRRDARTRHEHAAARPESLPMSLEQWETLRRLVDEAVEALPEDLRVPLIQAYLQGNSQQVVARHLGVSQATVSRRIEKGVERLREMLTRAGAELPPAAVVAGLAELPAIDAMPSEVAANLTRIGVSGTGGGGIGLAPAAESTAWSGWAIAALWLAALSLVAAGLFWAFSPGQSPPTVTIKPLGGPTMPANAPPAGIPAPDAAPQSLALTGPRLVPGLPDTSPYPQAMAIILQHLGHDDATYTRMMGYSGMAFALQMDLTGPIINGVYDFGWWPNDCWVFDIRLPFLSQAFGRELRKVAIDETDYKADAGKVYRDVLLPPIVEAIRAGRPALGQRDAGYVITGYDQAVSTVAAGFYASPGQPVFNADNPAPPWGLVVPGEPIAELPTADADVESLRWAIRLIKGTAVETIDKPISPWWATHDYKADFLTGARAWAKWQEMLGQDDGLGRDAWDNNMVSHLRYNRQAAAEFLRDMAGRYGSDAAQPLQAAAGLYEQMATLAGSAPFWGQFASNPELRPTKKREYADILRRIEALERESAGLLQQAIDAIEG